MRSISDFWTRVMIGGVLQNGGEVRAASRSQASVETEPDGAAEGIDWVAGLVHSSIELGDLVFGGGFEAVRRLGLRDCVGPKWKENDCDAPAKE